MGIISISADDRTLKGLEDAIKDGGYRGRSDAFRASLNLLIAEQKQQVQMKGLIRGILIVIHAEKHEADFTHARHKFEKLIKTSVHNQLGDEKCLEIFILEGPAEDVMRLLKACRKSGRGEYLKLITT